MGSSIRLPPSSEILKKKKNLNREQVLPSVVWLVLAKHGNRPLFKTNKVEYCLNKKSLSGVSQEKKEEDKKGELNGDGEKKDNAPTESKNAKKKKKRDKLSSKEVKESHDLPDSSDAANGLEEAAAGEQVEEETPAVDMKERLKKMASGKKKKSTKEMDGAARAAASEAAARSARLAAAKKKEKNHYNQQPVR